MDLASTIRDRLERTLSAKRNRLQEAEMVLRALQGESIASAMRAVSGASRDLSLPAWYKDRATINVLDVMVLTVSSIVTANNPRWVARPNGKSAAKYATARVADELLSYFWRTNEMRTLMDKVAYTAVALRTAGVFVDWDSLAYAGNVPDEGVGREGWFILEVANIFNTHWEPNVGGIDNAFWCMFETSMHVEEARLYFNADDIEPDKADGVRSGSQRHMRIVRESDSQDRSDDSEDRCTVLSYFEKPGRKHPRGLRVILAGKTPVVVEDELLFGEFPIYFFETRPRILADFGGGLGPALIKIQDQISKTIDTRQARRDQEVRPPWMDPNPSGTTGLSAAPGHINPYNARLGAPPSPMRLPDLSNSTLGLLNDQLEMMSMVSGVSDASMGQSPTSNSTGRMTALLAELDQRKIGPAIRSYGEKLLSPLGRRMLRLWQKFGSDTIAISVLGPGASVDVKEISQDDAATVYVRDLHVDIEALLPNRTAINQEVILNLIRMGVVEPEQGLAALEWGGMNEAMGWRNVEAENARQESADLDDYGTDEPEVNPWDDHKTHVQQHKRHLQLTRPDGAVRERHLRHLQAHMAATAPPPQPGQSPAGPINPNSLVEAGGLPSGVASLSEQGVDKTTESALASAAGITGVQ